MRIKALALLGDKRKPCFSLFLIFNYYGYILISDELDPRAAISNRSRKWSSEEDRWIAVWPLEGGERTGAAQRFIAPSICEDYGEEVGGGRLQSGKGHGVTQVRFCGPQFYRFCEIG